MHKKKYFIRQYSFLEYPHGGIGLADAEKILLTEGFAPIQFPYHNSFSVRAKIRRFLFLLRLLIVIPKKAVIIFVFPVYARINKLLIKGLLKKKATIICIVADIDGLKDADNNKLNKEISFFNSFRCLVVHNERMRQWVDTNLPGKQSETITFFDFLTKPVALHANLSFNIVFAGNLAKSKFLERLYLLPPPIHFHLYGPGQTQSMLAQKNVSWHGCQEPYSLPEKLQGSFGLVWDGESIYENAGALGEYIKYISPHKLSLYVISGLPIIAPAESAASEIISKYEIGFTVKSLQEIAGKVEQLSEETYEKMQKNCYSLANKISTGGCLTEALRNLDLI